MTVELIPVRPTLGGKTVRLVVPQGSRIADHIQKTGHFYEQNLLEYIQSLQLAGTYVNVGAHVGNHTVFFSDLCPSEEVIAIEPNDANFEVLIENTKTRPKVKALHAAACNDSGGTCPVSFDRKPGTSRVDFKSRVLPKNHRCPCVTVDEVCENKNVTLLKVDIHTDPTTVIAGARETIKRCQPVLAVDCNDADSACNAAEVLANLMYFNVAQIGDSDVSVCVPAKFRVVFPMFNRVDVTMNLLRDLARETRLAEAAGAKVSLCVYDDASTEDVSEVIDFLADRGWDYVRFTTNHGKKGFWEVVTNMFEDCRIMADTDVLVMMANDVRICTRFFERALIAWNSICDKKKGVLNIQAEQYRDLVAQWTNFDPKRHNKYVWKTQWNDGMLMCPIKVLRQIDFKIKKPNDVRWATPNISSGVWQWFSVTLNGIGWGMYRVHESLSVHVIVASSMHGGLRKKEPIRCARFADGPGAYARKLTIEPVFASLASIPSRESHLEKVVESLLPQVHFLRVYLNGYEKVPGFLNHERIVVARSQDTGDFGDAGKFHWCEGDSGYQLTCDDDLIYSENYVATFIEAIEKYDRKAVVGLHGVILSDPPRRNYYDCRKVVHWSSIMQNDRYVHLVGTGTVGYHSSAIDLKRSDFELPNMADVWLGLKCQEQKVPVVCIARKERMLELLECKWNIYTDQHGRDEAQAEAVNRIEKWQINKVGS